MCRGTVSNTATTKGHFTSDLTQVNSNQPIGLAVPVRNDTPRGEMVSVEVYLCVQALLFEGSVSFPYTNVGVSTGPG